MRRLIDRNAYFFIPFAGVLILAVMLLLTCDKAALHLRLTSFHTSFFDLLFKQITHLGNGVFILLLTFVLLFIKYRYAAMNMAVFLLSGMLVQVLKRLVFVNQVRPLAYFEEDGVLHLVEGVRMLKYHGFPSGHTATAFGAFLLLAFISRNRLIKLGCCFIALLAGFSRIYLSQHFLLDVVAGSLLGIISSTIIYIFASGRYYHWYDKSLLTYLRK